MEWVNKMHMSTRFLLLCTLLWGCQNREQDRRAVLSADELYFDYRVTGEEEKGSVTCLFKFRRGGPEGDAVRLMNSEKIELDGESLIADSARLSGVFYETEKHLPDFKGRHTIIFTGKRNKQFREVFEYSVFTLEGLPETADRKSFQLQLDGLPPDGMQVRLLLTDTAFATNDVIEVVYVKEGNLTITERMMDRLASGPIFLEIFYEEIRPLENTGRAGGRLLVSYGLRRSFILQG